MTGIPLELEDTEARLGRFSADILARDSRDGSRVLIENQLERSDHTHLGQILTYLVGHEARTVVWVARDFQKQNRSVIRWFNENTTAPLRFFAVAVSVSEDDDLHFQVREPLSERERQIETAEERRLEPRLRSSDRERSGDLSKRGQLLRGFWRLYCERYPDDGVPQDLAGYNAYHDIDDSELRVSQFVAPKSGVVGVFIGKQRNADSQTPFSIWPTFMGTLS